MAGEMCSMRHTKDEHQRWWHVRHPFAAEPPKRILRIRSGERSPEEMPHDFLELIGSVPADYTPLFMNQSYIIWE